MKFDIRKIAVMGVVAAAYVALTLSLGSLAYMGVQFRVSEALMLLCFYRKEYCYALSAGCFISNMFSPMPIDMLVGTAATVIAAAVIYLIGKNAAKARLFKMLIASLAPVIANGVIVGFELKFAYGLPLLLTMGQVALGELVCVTILGTVLFYFLEKNKNFMKLICFGEANIKA